MPIQQITTGIIANGAITVADVADATITGAKLAANTLANSVFQTGSVENYMRGAGLGFGMRNRIINGAMVIDQRNAGANTTLTTSAYTLDRWFSYTTESSKFSIQQNAGSVTPPVGFTNYIGATSLSAYSITSGDYFSIMQRIEGYNVTDLGWGSANAKTVTLSFWVYSSLTGTFGGSFRNSAGNRSYPYTYTISSANTWEYKTVTIAGDTSGTWLTTNGIGVDVLFSLGTGSTFLGTAGAWAGANYLGATGQVNMVATSGATFYITGVQLEVGSTATSFDYRPYGTELQLCQRYLPAYQLSGGQNVCIISSYSSGNWITAFPTVVPTRAPATGVVYTGTIANTILYYSASGIAVTGISFNGATNSTVSFNITTAGTSLGIAGLWATQAAAATLYFTGCEL